MKSSVIFQVATLFKKHDLFFNYFLILNVAEWVIVIRYTLIYLFDKNSFILQADQSNLEAVL